LPLHSPQGSQWCSTDLNILAAITSAFVSFINLKHAARSYPLLNSSSSPRAPTHTHKFFFRNGNMEVLSLSVLNKKRVRTTTEANQINIVIYFPFFLRPFCVTFPLISLSLLLSSIILYFT
jgi:hypothetical protein